MACKWIEDLSSLIEDIRFALRQILKHKSVTLAILCTMALGIGANTAIFTVVNAVLLRSLPYREPDRLVAVFEKRVKENNLRNVVSPADFIDWREECRSFDYMAAWTGDIFHLIDGEPERIQGGFVTAALFEAMGVSMKLGGGFRAEHEVPGNHRVVVLSHVLWQRRFGSDPGIVGKPVNLGGNLYTVAGVLPEHFEFPFAEFELYVPFAIGADQRNSRGSHFLNVIGKLRNGVSEEEAQRELDVIAARLEKEHAVNLGHGANVVPLRESLASDIRPMIGILAGAVGFVLLIACANVANLLLARAVARRREICIRMALGAGRWRIVRLALVESLMLAVFSGIAGVLAAQWITDGLLAILPRNALAPVLTRLQVDGTVLGFTAAATIVSGLLFGLAPASMALRSQIQETLKSGAQAVLGGREALRKTLVVSQVALSVVLLAGAALLIRSFEAVRNQYPGFRAENVLTMHIVLPFQSYSENHKRIAFLQQLEERLRSLPGVVQAGVTSHLPVSGFDSRGGFVVEGSPPDPNEPRRAHYRVVSPGYFESLRIPLIAGRYFTSRDNANAPPVLLVNEAAARKYWPKESPVGNRARFSSSSQWHEVVGVVQSVRHCGLEVEARPEAYLSNLQAPFWSNFFTIRASGNPRNIIAAAREQVRAVDKQLPVGDIRSMDEVVAMSLSQRRFSMLLLGFFAAMALAVAAAGIYGVMSYLVSARTREIGLRMALGAARGDVFRYSIGPGMRLVLLGAAAGAGGALALTWLMEKMIYQVSTRDPSAFAAAVVFLVVVAFLASLAPARRAMKVDPAIALRHE